MVALCTKTVYQTQVFAWVRHGSTAWDCHRLSRWERHKLMRGELDLLSVYLPYTPTAWTTHVVVMHTHINYKGTCVIEVKQKCYSVISQEQEEKYVERHKSNGDTIIFPFPLSTKQPILDAVNMRQRTRRNGRVQPGPLQYVSRLLQALKRWPCKGSNYLKLKQAGRCAAEPPLTPLNLNGNWTPVAEKAQEPRDRRSYMLRLCIVKKGWTWNCAVGFMFAWHKDHHFYVLRSLVCFKFLC